MKVIILGLDGATWDVLWPRIERGAMPHLTGLLEQGAWGSLRSTIPPFSAQAWTSLSTGKNQARHGVVDFWERDPRSPGERRTFVSSRQVQGETLWQTAGRHGRRVGVVNVPVTYPPTPVNGYLVSGFLTPPGRTDYVYPATLKDEIEALVPGYKPDPFDPLGATRQQLVELVTWMERHETVARYLLDGDPPDLFFGVVQAIDHLQHLFWNEIDGTASHELDELHEELGSRKARKDATDAEGLVRGLIERCYGMADGIIGDRLRRLDGWYRPEEAKVARNRFRMNSLRKHEDAGRIVQESCEHPPHLIEASRILIPQFALRSETDKKRSGQFRAIDG